MAHIFFSDSSCVFAIAGFVFFKIAPEVVEESHNYTERSDCWALGRILFEMACGEPLPAPRNYRVEAGIMRAIRGKYGFKIWMALRMMLAELPNERASLGDVYEYLKFDPIREKRVQKKH